MPDGAPWPKVSIVTPSLNQGRFIEETIRSVLLQGYPNLELIIVDGGSTDGTIDIIRKYESWITHWVSEPDTGQSDAINKGWKRSSGDILAWINSDDTFCPETIWTVAEMFVQDSEIVLVSGAGNVVDMRGEIVSPPSPPPDMNPYRMIRQCKGVPVQPSVFFKRRVLKDVGFLDTRLHFVMDWDFWIRIGLQYGQDQMKQTNRVLSNYRTWADTKTNTGWRQSCQERRRVLDKIFEKFSNERKIMSMKRSAYSASYRVQAAFARGNVDTLQAIKCLLRAWRLAPSDYSFTREMQFLLSVILGCKRRTKWKECFGHGFLP
jgi:glycosyltransferase involved in cell wall biosynthesis